MFKVDCELIWRDFPLLCGSASSTLCAQWYKYHDYEATVYFTDMNLYLLVMSKWKGCGGQHLKRLLLTISPYAVWDEIPKLSRIPLISGT